MLPRAANFWIRNDPESFENLFFDFSKGILISRLLWLFSYFIIEIIFKDLASRMQKNFIRFGNNYAFGQFF